MIKAPEFRGGIARRMLVSEERWGEARVRCIRRWFSASGNSGLTKRKDRIAYECRRVITEGTIRARESVLGGGPVALSSIPGVHSRRDKYVALLVFISPAGAGPLPH